MVHQLQAITKLIGGRWLVVEAAVLTIFPIVLLVYAVPVLVWSAIEVFFRLQVIFVRFMSDCLAWHHISLAFFYWELFGDV